MKKAAEAVGHGRDVTKKHVPLITNLMHWGYGLWWGTAYGVAARSPLGANPVARRPRSSGSASGLRRTRSSSRSGSTQKPGSNPPQELALDLSYHLAYGIAARAPTKALER